MVWRYNNQILPSQKAKQIALLEEILGDRGQAVIEPPFHCDYGFNIHFAGRAYVNYNAVFLDTSPISIGKNVLIGPNAIFSCAGHSLFPEERMQLSTSKAITLADNVWLGARVTVLAGVKIGQNTVVGANSLVNHDLPANVVAVGTPCKILRQINSQDKLARKNVFNQDQL